MQGIAKVELFPRVPSLGEGSSDENALRRLFLDQQSYYAGKRTPGETIGVINGQSAKATLFDDGTAIVFIWKSKRLLTVKWTIA
jgi:hypothetical protein